eukprot:scaffold35866_cov124-Isochrysis_galbana.AAC.7
MEYRDFSRRSSKGATGLPCSSALNDAPSCRQTSRSTMASAAMPPPSAPLLRCGPSCTAGCCDSPPGVPAGRSCAGATSPGEAFSCRSCALTSRSISSAA